MNSTNAANLDAFELKVENHLDGPYQGVAGFGTCLPPNAARDGAQFHFTDRNGKLFPATWRLLLPAKNSEPAWAYFSLPLSLRRLEFKHFQLKSGPGPAHPRLELQQEEGSIRVQNGEDEIVFDARSPLGLSSLSRAGVLLLAGEGGAEMEFESGTYRVVSPLELSIKNANDFEIVVQAQGELQLKNPVEGDAIFFRLRYTIHINRPGFALNVLFSNRRKSDQELLLKRMTIGWDLAASTQASFVRQMATDNLCLAENQAIAGEISIRDGKLENPSLLPLPEVEELYPFFRTFDLENFFGRVAPFLGMVLPGGGLVASWSRSSHLEASGASNQNGRLEMELVSPNAGGRRIPQGFSRSFDLTFTSHAGALDCHAANKLREVADIYPLVSVHPNWYIENDADEMRRVLPYRPDLHPRFEQNFWREIAKGYFSGFYHSGDWASGRGSAQMHAEAKSYTWNNNEEDNLKGIAWQLMRTGDPSYGEDLRVCGRHLLEVDRVAYASHALQSGVLLAHSLNHFDGTGYPSHCWAEGLLLYFKLTGDDDALEAFFGVCDCLLEWAKTPDAMRFVDAREIGVPITNFAHAFVLSGEQKYYDAAQPYIAHLKKQMDEDGGLYYKNGIRLMLYSEYVAVEGLWDWFEMFGGDDIKKLLMDIIIWIDRYGLDAFGYYDARGTSESMLQIFYVAFKLTGDEAWLEKGRKGMESGLSQTAGLPQLKFGNNAAFYKEAMERGWFRDDVVSLTPYGYRAVARTYALPNFEWEKKAILYDERES